jgi:diguanylate cyclase (GGDEF)-like protein
MKILLVDDNEKDLKTSASLVEEVGHTPIVCDNAHEALTFFDSDASTPYLIITDWEMPDMDGSELCQRLRNLPFTVSPYIILTSAGEFSDAEVCALENGADDFIEKPMSLRSLTARIRVAERILSTQLNLRNLALTDGLTGLLNRRAGMTAIQTQIARIDRHDELHGCVIMCDIDYFKRINDNYGHTAGDVVLREVANRMSESLRPFDTICRYGGEEFLIFCEAGEKEITAILDRIMDVVSSEPVMLDNGDYLDVTLSMGCHVDEQPAPLTSKLKQADALLYQAKGNGRNQYVTDLAAAGASS